MEKNLKKYMYACVTKIILLYIYIWNIVNQLYFSKYIYIKFMTTFYREKVWKFMTSAIFLAYSQVVF